MPALYPGGQLLTPDEQRQAGLLPPGPLSPPSPTGVHQQPAQPGSHAPPSTGLFASPKGFFGPGLLANLKARHPESTLPAFRELFELAGRADVSAGRTSPEDASQKAARFAEAPGGVAKALLPFFLPGSTVPRQALAQGLFGAAEATGEGKDPSSALLRGLLTAGGTGLFGGSAKAILRQRAGAKAAKGLTEAQQAFEKQTATAKEGFETAKVAHAASVEQQAATFAQQSRAHAETSASQIATALKQKVPALRGIPSTEEGLISMLKGRGIRAVGREFDKSLEQVIQRGEGQLVKIGSADARKLGLEQAGFEGTQEATTAAEDLQFVRVKAGELAKSLVGRWKKDPGLYRRGADVLDAAGIGDPPAREAYRTWRGISKAINDAGAIESSEALGKFVFNPAKLLKGMAKEKILQEVTKRGLGDIESGMLQAARGGPLTPRPIPQPTAPRLGSPPPQSIGELPGFATRPNPLARHPFITGMGLEGLAQGGLHALGAGPAARIAAMPAFFAGAALPKDIVTRAPLNPTLVEVLQRFPGVLNALLGQQ